MATSGREGLGARNVEREEGTGGDVIKPAKEVMKRDVLGLDSLIFVGWVLKTVDERKTK